MNLKWQPIVILLVLTCCKEAKKSIPGIKENKLTATPSSKQSIVISDSLYADFDFYRMKGVSLLPKKSFPAFAVRDSFDFLIVTSYLDSVTSSSLSFFKNANLWTSKYQVSADTSGTYYHCVKIVDARQIFTFTYKDSASTSLIDLEIVNDKLVEHYNFGQGIHYSPDPANIDRILTKARLKGFTRYEARGEVMHVYSENADSTGKIYHKNEECFSANNKSIHWWIDFGSNQPETDCGNLNVKKGK